MSAPSDAELHEIVRQVMQRVLSGESESAARDQFLQPVQKPIQEEKPMIAIGSDHGGFRMKESLKAYLVELGYGVADCGTKDTNAVDYPDFAHAVALMVSKGEAWCGVVIDGAGIGSCMTANKVPGVRAAMCYDISTAINSREHNDANVLTLGAGQLGDSLVKQIVKTWLATDFGGGRHARRVDKIKAIEKFYLKSEN